MKNTMRALSASFLINAVHESSILRLYRYNVPIYCINRKPQHERLTEAIPEHTFLGMLKRKQELPLMLETKLFVYYYES